MMMERAKTAPAPEPTTTTETSTELEKPQAASAPAPDVNASAEDRVQDLERRLDMLGGESTAPPAATTTPAPAAAAAPEKPKEPQTGKSNPLLKRIQAAQERARQAEQKEKEAKATAAAEIERKKHDEEQAKLRAAEEEHIAKAQSALRSVASRAVEDKQKEIMMQLEGKTPTPTTMTTTTTAASPEKATQGVPIMKTLDPPPPTFDSMKFPPTQQQPMVSNEMVGHGMNSRALLQPPAPVAAAPPSFDFVEHQMTSTPVEQSSAPAPTAPSISPSAPPITMPEEDHLHGIMPVSPPQQQHQAAPPPPSFAQFEQQAQPSTDNAQTSSVPGEDEGVFDYDLDGNPLSPEQRQALLDEQRHLYESIMKEKAANDAAIAQANADSFDQRSSTAAARAMSPGTSSNTQAVQNEAMDAVGRDAATGEEGNEEDEEEARRRERRMVKIGNNQMVALHGQDRTKKAIKEGTAILVQCINCQNWMQVTDTATLMFCPVCQVVSPVIQQNEVMTKEEAIQLTMDRKLAEKLQAEAYADQDDEGDEEGERGAEEDEGFFGRMFGLSSSTSTAAPAATSGKAHAAGAQSDTWWDKISSVVSYGVADEGPKDRGDMGVSLPPGAPTAQYPANRRGSPTAAASRSPTHAEETRGLLSPVVDGNEANLPSGRVAESKPLFSCIADSMAGAASALYSTGDGDAEGNVHGVDAHSLLMTNAGRGVDGSGDYSQLPNRE